LNLVIEIRYMRLKVNYKLHTIHWLIYSTLIFIIIGNNPVPGSPLLKTGLFIFVQASIFYMNFFLLVPKFLARRKILYYTLFIVLIILIQWLVFYLFQREFIHVEVNEELTREIIRNKKMGVRLAFTNIFSMVSVLFISTVLYFIRLSVEREKQQLEMKQELQESELKLLKSQINPHFLFNALNNIYTLSLIKSEKTPDSIHELSIMLRYVLYECNEPFVPLEKEVEYIRNYIELMKLKDDRIQNINFEYSKSIGSVKIAPMLLIPFVENAFKHSNFENYEKGWINIRLDGDEQNIWFEMANSIEASKQSKDGGNGIGLKNVESRLRSVYFNKYKLDINQEKDEYRVKLKINHKDV